MAECFCGCGREVSRGMNKQGHRTAGLVAKLGAARELVASGEPIRKPKRVLRVAMMAGDLDADDFAAVRARTPEGSNPFSVMIVEVLDELIDDGQEYEVFWQGAVHGDTLPPPDEARRIKREWNRWGRQGMTLCRAIGVPVPRFGGLTAEG